MTVSRHLPPMFPRAVERQAAAAGLRYVRAWRRLVEPGLLRELRRRADEGEERQAVRYSLFGLLNYLSRTEEEIPEGAKITPAMLGRYGVIVQQHAEGQTRRVLQMPTLTAVNPARGSPGAVTEWADEAASRIVIIAEDYRSRVARIIETGYDLGRSGETIAREIERIGAATENRARLWARDQIATINAQATESAHQRAGVTHYRWWTAQDERVRDEPEPGGNHRERQGVIFAWSRPPAESQYDGHPGHPINCRCVAIPIPPDDLDAALAEQAARGNLPPFAAT